MDLEDQIISMHVKNSFADIIHVHSVWKLKKSYFLNRISKLKFNCGQRVSYNKSFKPRSHLGIFRKNILCTSHIYYEHHNHKIYNRTSHVCYRTSQYILEHHIYITEHHKYIIDHHIYTTHTSQNIV
jgi:hypothetical protein